MARQVSVEGNNFLVLTWEDIIESVEKLACMISETYKFETIIGILRGGLFVANLLSDILDIEEVHPLGIRSYTGINERGDVKIYHWPALPVLSDKRVLLIDDVSDEGRTLKVAVDEVLSPLNPQELRTAVLQVKPWTKFMPNYYVQSTSSWIIYPWSRYEGIRKIGRGLVPKVGFGRSVDLLADLLGLSRDKVSIVLASHVDPLP